MTRRPLPGSGSGSTPGLSRRGFLGAAAAAPLIVAGCADDVPPTQGAGAVAIDAQPIAWRGTHQAGVVTPGPANAIVASFRSVVPDRAGLVEMFKAISSEIDALVHLDMPTDDGPLYPPADNLILGPAPTQDQLTITLSVGASLFDGRYGLTDRRPAHLVEMPKFANDRLDPAKLHGDVCIQICSTNPDSCVHALRRIMRATRRDLTLAWMLPAFQRPNTLGAGQTDTRNLMGFKDGTANPDHSSARLMDELVWVQPGDSEPAWTVGGSYQVVRLIRMRVEFWDRTALRTQETIMGRSKSSGAPLDGTAETDAPRFADDPDGRITPLRAHIRLANPRTPATEKNRILRRGFSYSGGFTPDGQLDQGLLFVAYQRNLEDGFNTVQGRLDGEALEEYITPFGGGFFFTLPGAPDGAHLGQSLLA